MSDSEGCALSASCAARAAREAQWRLRQLRRGMPAVPRACLAAQSQLAGRRTWTDSRSHLPDNVFVSTCKTGLLQMLRRLTSHACRRPPHGVPSVPPVPADLALTLIPDQQRRQVLYFMPAVRAAFLALAPDADAEFSLADELGLLFRMLAGGGPGPRAASNLLRALRQNRQAAALGLLETHKQRSGQARCGPGRRRAEGAPRARLRRQSVWVTQAWCRGEYAGKARAVALAQAAWSTNACHSSVYLPQKSCYPLSAGSEGLPARLVMTWPTPKQCHCLSLGANCLFIAAQTGKPVQLLTRPRLCAAWLHAVVAGQFPGDRRAGLGHRGGDHQGPLPSAALPVAAALPAGAAAPRAGAARGRCGGPWPQRGSCREPRRRAGCRAGRRARPRCRRWRCGGRGGRGQHMAWTGRARDARRSTHNGSRAAVGARRGVRRAAGAGAGRARRDGGGAALPAQRAPAHAVPVGLAPGQARAGAPGRILLSAHLFLAPLPRCRVPLGGPASGAALACCALCATMRKCLWCSTCMDRQRSSAMATRSTRSTGARYSSLAVAPALDTAHLGALVPAAGLRCAPLVTRAARRGGPQVKEAASFQTELQYPPARARPPLAPAPPAEEPRAQSFRPGASCARALAHGRNLFWPWPPCLQACAHLQVRTLDRALTPWRRVYHHARRCPAPLQALSAHARGAICA